MGLLFFQSCYKDAEERSNETEVKELPQIKIDTELSGYVVSSIGDTLNNYVLSIAGKKYSVNNTFFEVALEDVNKRGVGVEILKDNKTIGLATVLLIENDINRCEIKVFPNGVDVRAGHTQVNRYVDLHIDESGNSEDKVLATVSDLTEIPLTPVVYSQSSQVLSPQGNYGFYLETKGLNNFSSFSINIKVDAPRQDMICYRYNAELDLWETIAQLKKGDNTIKVDKEGFYGISDVSEGVFAEGKIVMDSLPVSYVEIHTDQNTHISYTSSRGRWIRVMAEEQSQGLGVLDCNRLPTYTSIDVSEGDMRYTEIAMKEDIGVTRFTSRFIDCEGKSVQKARINCINESQTVRYKFREDEVDTYLPLCGTKEILVSDGTRDNISVDHTDTQVYLGYYSTCQQHKQGYSYISICDEPSFYDSFRYTYVNGDLHVVSANKKIKIIIRKFRSKEIKEEQVNIHIDDKNFQGEGYYMSCLASTEGCGIQECYVEKEGEKIVLSFKGNLWIQSVSSHSVGYCPIEATILAEKE